MHIVNLILLLISVAATNSFLNLQEVFYQVPPIEDDTEQIVFELMEPVFLISNEEQCFKI